jgi:hypothetical protein
MTLLTNNKHMNTRKLKKVVVQTGLLWAGVCLAANAMAASTPLLDFNFDEGKGTNVTDSTSHLVGRLGAYIDPVNDPVVVTDTPSGAADDKAVSLNFASGTTDGFLVADDSIGKVLAGTFNNAFTIETWVKYGSTPVWQWTFEGLGGYGHSWKLDLNGGKMIFTLAGVVDIESGLSVPGDGDWHHVAVVWQPGVGATFYLDGGNETFIPNTDSMRAFSDNYLAIGAESTSGNAIHGMIDRFRIHNAILTLDQLDSVAASPKAPLGTTLVDFEFTESAPPFSSSAAAALMANPSNPYVAALTQPTFITDSPSAMTNDYALSFKAGNSVTVPDPSRALALDPVDPSFTIQVWLKFGTLPNPNQTSVIFYNGGPGGAISFSICTDLHLQVTMLGVLDVKSPNASIPGDGNWHHAAVVHENGKEVRFYVDGGLVDTVAYTGGVIFTRTDTSFTLGSETGGNMPFAGSIDRFKVAKGVLTADQLDSKPVPVVPGLTIERSVRVTWPTTPSGYILQSSTDLGDTKNWTSITATPLLDSRGYYMVFPSSAVEVFYRLYKP